ncbi:hypothetical protein SARC_04742, partial [Sphaeroforma arctica JP610]
MHTHTHSHTHSHAHLHAHARTPSDAVITTWDVKNANIFWTAMMKMPLGTHQIMTYKCMIIVHKLLHDGHPSVIPATYHQKT